MGGRWKVREGPMVKGGLTVVSLSTITMLIPRTRVTVNRLYQPFFLASTFAGRLTMRKQTPYLRSTITIIWKIYKVLSMDYYINISERATPDDIEKI